MSLIDRVLTAGAFVKHQGRWVFVVGPTAAGDRLGVVRLGGHREHGETPWECVQREVLEEAAVHIRYVHPPATYWFQGDTENLALEERTWQHDGIAPLIVATRDAADDGPVTLLYVALSDDSPMPSAETRGLLFLTPLEIEQVVSNRITLQEHLDAGGQAILREGFPTTLPLAPFYHICLLQRIVAWHPELSVT